MPPHYAFDDGLLVAPCRPRHRGAVAKRTNSDLLHHVLR